MDEFMHCLGRRNKRNDNGRPKETASVEPGSNNPSIDDVMLVSADGSGSTVRVQHQQHQVKSDHELDSHSHNRQLAIRLAVATIDGNVWEANVNPGFTVDKLKKMALCHFQNPAETIKIATKYRLVVTCTPEKQLNEEFTLLQEGIKNNDELILLKKTIQGPPLPSELQNELAPDEATIKQITANVPVKNADRVAKETVTVVDFQVELRKTLVSLIDVAQKIQLYNKNNLLSYIGYPQVNSIGASEQRKDLVDPLALKQLTDMGFSIAKARKALLQKQMSAMDALEQLLLQENRTDVKDDDDEDGTSSDEFPSSGTLGDTSSEPSPLIESATSSSSSDEITSCSSELPTTLVQPSPNSNRLISLKQLLDLFRAYKRREFRPNMKAFCSLRDMGFDQDKIVDALRVSGNKHDAAFEWLLSRWLTDDDLRHCLDPDGSVHKAIIANPIIQLGLNNPKVLYAFLHMLENPNCANHWLNDPDTAPILNQIFKIYHLEKYSLQIKPPTTEETT